MASSLTLTSMLYAGPGTRNLRRWCERRGLFTSILLVKLLTHYAEGATTSTTTTDAPASSDEETDEVLSRAMLIGLCVGFGSLCGVIIVCCICFKCCDCTHEQGASNHVTSSKRRVAWS